MPSTSSQKVQDNFPWIVSQQKNPSLKKTPTKRHGLNFKLSTFFGPKKKSLAPEVAAHHQKLWLVASVAHRSPKNWCYRGHSLLKKCIPNKTPTNRFRIKLQFSMITGVIFLWGFSQILRPEVAGIRKPKDWLGMGKNRFLMRLHEIYNEICLPKTSSKSRAGAVSFRNGNNT